METFYIWTIGCQMNKADSERLATALEQLGLHSVGQAHEADVIVLELLPWCAKAPRTRLWVPWERCDP